MADKKIVATGRRIDGKMSAQVLEELRKQEAKRKR